MKRIQAALIFFTRLPIWKIANPPQSAYKDVVVLWPLVGWLSGGLVALLMYGLSFIMAWPAAVVLALAGRMLLTGALHEDGFADFCDGFGCGGERSRILAIMKDSHIGTYGVIALIINFLLAISILTTLPPAIAALGFFSADAGAKCCAAQLTNRLPYARPEGAKNGISYSKMSAGDLCLCLTCGVLPTALAMFLIGWEYVFIWILPILTLLWMISAMRRKIGGYTGDCCGAADIACELSFLISISIIFNIF